MCNHKEHGCSVTNRVAPQHYLASLALNQNLSTKFKFPQWLSNLRTIAVYPKTDQQSDSPPHDNDQQNNTSILT